MNKNRCPASPDTPCPWLASLDSLIGFAKEDLERRRFFGKKGAQQMLDSLIDKRAAAQQVILLSDCPAPERNADGYAVLCGVHVMNTAMQNLEAELAEPFETE